jgi:hypothetical protein
VLTNLLISKFAGPIIRHAGTVIAGFLVAQGWADEGIANEIAGGFVAAASLGLSYMEKEIRD